VVAALEAAYGAELRRVEELVVVLRDELEVRRREQAEEREAHRREVAQLHTLLAQSHQLALPRPAAPPDPAPEDAGNGDPAPPAAAADGWWRRAMAWLRG
jgi:hypothetical protein